jgi:hypothetical protein
MFFHRYWPIHLRERSVILRFELETPGNKMVSVGTEEKVAYRFESKG